MQLAADWFKAPLLDPQETKSTDTRDLSAEDLIANHPDPAVRFRHSGWRRARKATFAALHDSQATDHQLIAFAACGSNPWLVQSASDPDQFKVHWNTCHSRWCVPCNGTRAHTIAANLERQIAEDFYYFATLTLKHSSTPLRAQIDRIYASFRVLRATPFWKTRITGGGAILEIKHSTRSKQWHPHLHICCRGKNLSQFPLSDAWFRVTGDSFIVDVDEIRSKRDVARYVTKYVTKPIPFGIYTDPGLLVELIQACKGRRTVLTFGDWRGIRLCQKLDSTVWLGCCSIDELLRRVRRLDPLAVKQHALLIERYPGFMAAMSPGPPGNLLPY